LKDGKKENSIKKIQKKNAPKQSVKRNADEVVKASQNSMPETPKKTVSPNLSKTQKEGYNNQTVKPLQIPPVRNMKRSPQQQTSILPAESKQKSSNNKLKKRYSIHKFSGLLKIFSLLIALLLITSFTVIKLGGIAGSNFSDGVKSMFSAFSPGNGFPYQISGTDLKTIDMIGSDILISVDGSAEVINSTAKETLSFQDTFSKAVTDVCNGRAIMFDRSSGNFKVLSRTGVLFEKDMGQNILVAAIGKKGNFAVATESKTAQSELKVYDSNKSQIFVWVCAVERISSLALSDDGKRIAVTVVGAKDGELYSKLFVFAFNENKTVASFDYPETALIKVKFTGKTTAVAIGDKLMSIINLETKQKQDVSFGTDELHRLYVHESGKTAIVLASFGNAAQSELKVYGSKGEPLFKKSFNEEIKWVSCDMNYTSVLLANKVQSFNNKGDLMGNIKLAGKAEKILISGKKTYVVSGGNINQFSTVGKEQ